MQAWRGLVEPFAARWDCAGVALVVAIDRVTVRSEACSQERCRRMRVGEEQRLITALLDGSYGTDSGPGSCRGNHVRRASESAVATTEGVPDRVPLARTVVACPVHTT